MSMPKNVVTNRRLNRRRHRFCRSRSINHAFELCWKLPGPVDPKTREFMSESEVNAQTRFDSKRFR